MVFCGRYLSRAAFERISLWLDQEGEVLFPLGLPQYDENMQRLEEWNVSACRREESDPMYKLYSFVQRKAKVSFITDCKDPILWPKLIELFGSALGSNPVLPGEER
jgi:hypothetical protein